MSSLRAKRIEILQGLQGTEIETRVRIVKFCKIVKIGLGKYLLLYFLGCSDSPSSTRTCNENMTTAPTLPLSSLTLTEHTVNPCNPATTPSILSPPTASSPPVFSIKQERLSPVTVIPAREPTDSPITGPHSTTPEQSVAATTETGVEPASLGSVLCSHNQNISLLILCW